MGHRLGIMAKHGKQKRGEHRDSGGSLEVEEYRNKDVENGIFSVGMFRKII